MSVARLENLAATDFPAPWGAVSWALGFFTSEFGMGSGVGTPPKPPGRRAYPRGRCVAFVWVCGWVLVRVREGVLCVGGLL